MQVIVGQSANAARRQGLKRKQSGDMDCASALDIASIHRELIFTQQELQLLRMQYFQLHERCSASMPGFHGAMQSGISAMQPGAWPGMSVPFLKRHALLTQVQCYYCMIAHFAISLLFTLDSGGHNFEARQLGINMQHDRSRHVAHCQIAYIVA